LPAGSIETEKPMKYFFLFILAVRIFCNPLHAADATVNIVTLTGKTYKNAVVTSVSPVEITVSMDAGIAHIPFAILPPELRAKYGYSRPQAEAYLQAHPEAKTKVIGDFMQAEAEKDKEAAEKKRQDELMRISTNILSINDKIVSLQKTTKGMANTLSVSDNPRGEEPASILDGNLATKYFNKAKDGDMPPGVNTGFAITPAKGATVVAGIQFATANDCPERDPLQITVEGSNGPDALTAGSDYKVIYEGGSGLDQDPGRKSWGRLVVFPNSTAYSSYRVLVTALRGGGGSTPAAPATQYSEVKLVGVPSTAK
jgi:hypothetical protein